MVSFNIVQCMSIVIVVAITITPTFARNMSRIRALYEICINSSGPQSC